VLIGLLLIVALVAAYFRATLTWSYAVGGARRMGAEIFPQGWIFKTWEGEMAMVVDARRGDRDVRLHGAGERRGGAIQQADGPTRRAALRAERSGSDELLRRHRYFVTKVTLVEEIPLAPGVVVPTPAPSAPAK